MITKQQHPEWNEVLRTNDCAGIARHLARGIDPNETVLWNEEHAGSPPLCIAWKVPSMKLLLDAGADPNTMEELPPNPKEGWSYNLSYSLERATEREDPEIIQLLIDHGAKVRNELKTIRNPLWSAILSVSSKRGVQVVEILLEHFGKEQVSRIGSSLLCVAAGNKSARGVIAALVELGADPNEPENETTLPLQKAIRENNARGVEELLELGADPNANSPEASGYYGDNILSCMELAKKLKKRKLVGLLEAAAKASSSAGKKKPAGNRVAAKKASIGKKAAKKRAAKKKSSKKPSSKKKAVKKESGTKKTARKKAATRKTATWKKAAKKAARKKR